MSKSRIIVGEFRLIAMREAPNEGFIEASFLPEEIADPLKAVKFSKSDLRGMWICMVPKPIADELRLQTVYTIQLKAKK